jgi:hypothetical protein
MCKWDELLLLTEECVDELFAQAGMHYRSDIEAGLALGRAVADLLAERDAQMVQP